MNSDASHSFKILIAEDSATDRLILETIVSKAGHIPLVVCDGIEAIECYRRESPDLVLLDVMMPKLGGIDVARKIREVGREDIVPIIFLTSLSDEDSLVECLDAGGDDFIPKPYNQVVLQSKINSFGRLRRMHSTVLRQKRQIEDHNHHLIREQTVAKQVFDKIAHTGSLDLPYIRHYMSPLAVFNGDVLVSEISPRGNMLLLLGDFTGHGLPAAIGSMPLASIFYAMARKGFAMADILVEINRKLNAILPVGFFCCAIFIEIDFRQGRANFWNGGLPEAFVHRAGSRQLNHVASKNLPLGVLSDSAFKCGCESLEMHEGDRIFMWSDGIFEARNAEGEMFGESRLHQIFHDNIPASDVFDSILEKVHGHIGSSEKDDDITLVQVEMPASETAKIAIRERPAEKNWHLSRELNAAQLKVFDPLSLLNEVLAEIPSLQSYRTALYAIIAELYANGLEYGVLGMSSFAKSTSEGFSEYYRERRERLNALENGKIQFDFSHLVDASGGVLNIQVRDSGSGFESGNHHAVASPVAYSGRGLAIVEALARSVKIHPPGNHVEVVYRWYKRNKSS